MRWLLMDVGCAECRMGWDPLVEVIDTFTSVDDARTRAERLREIRRGWQPREDGGVYEDSGQGGFEIIPIL
jgi:hypothetical protein